MVLEVFRRAATKDIAVRGPSNVQEICIVVLLLFGGKLTVTGRQLQCHVSSNDARQFLHLK